MFNNPYFLVGVFGVAYLITCKLFAKREGYYSTVTVFGIGCYLYYAGVPVELTILNNGYFERGDVRFYLSPENIATILQMSIVAFLSFSLGYYLSGFNPVLPPAEVESRSKRGVSIPYSLRFLLTACLLVIVTLYPSEFAAIGSYEGSYTTTYTRPEFQLLTSICYFCIAMIGSILAFRPVKKHRIIGITLIFMIIGLGLYSSDKDPILAALLALGSYFVGQKSRNFLFLLGSLLGCAVIIFLFSLFSIFRGGGGWSLLSIFLEFFGLRYADPGGPIVSLDRVLNEPGPLLLGSSYLNALYIFIPRFIWSGRPLDLSVAFAQENISDWSEGLGMGYSLLAEAYANFGFWGSFIQYLFLGLLWGWFWKMMQSRLWHFRVECWNAFYYILGYYLLIIMHRGPFSGTFKSVLHYSVAIGFFALLFDQSVLSRKRKAMMSPHRAF